LIGELHSPLQCLRLDFLEDALSFKETPEVTSTTRSFKQTFSFHLKQCIKNDTHIKFNSSHELDFLQPLPATFSGGH
jgi:hypothetical protein